MALNHGQDTMQMLQEEPRRDAALSPILSDHHLRNVLPRCLSWTLLVAVADPPSWSLTLLDACIAP